MKTILIGGSKESGKTTTATAIYGYHLVSVGAIPNAIYDTEGRMSIIYNEERNEGIIFNIDNTDEEFVNWKNANCSKYVSHVSFADELKNTCSRQFGLDISKLKGSNDQKNELTHIKWANIAKLLSGARKNELKKIGKLDQFMTHREFMEVLGTEIFREIDPLCHINSAKSKLAAQNCQIGIIPDLRFENELVEFENDPNIIKIRLLRNIHQSEAKSENGLGGVDNSRFDLVVPADLNVTERNQLVIDFLVRADVLEKHNVKVEI